MFKLLDRIADYLVGDDDDDGNDANDDDGEDAESKSGVSTSDDVESGSAPALRYHHLEKKEQKQFRGESVFKVIVNQREKLN